jgi:hypothetical protein
MLSSMGCGMTVLLGLTVGSRDAGGAGAPGSRGGRAYQGAVAPQLSNCAVVIADDCTDPPFLLS